MSNSFYSPVNCLKSTGLMLIYLGFKEEAAGINYRGFLYWDASKPHTTSAGQFGVGKSLANVAGEWVTPGSAWRESITHFT
jgi:hypothetical protein